MSIPPRTDVKALAQRNQKRSILKSSKWENVALCMTDHLNANRKWKEKNYLLGFYFYSRAVSLEK